jgi:hypothetical protein
MCAVPPALEHRAGHGDQHLEDGVRFADGSREGVDVIINCTGYRVNFPFLDEDVVRVQDDRVELFFLGLVQPIGSVLPIAHGQATRVADLLDGLANLPSTHEMQSHISRYRHQLDERFPGSPRHAMEVDLPEDYLHALSRERRAGIRRAKKSSTCA